MVPIPSRACRVGDRHGGVDRSHGRDGRRLTGRARARSQPRLPSLVGRDDAIRRARRHRPRTRRASPPEMPERQRRRRGRPRTSLAAPTQSPSDPPGSRLLVHRAEPPVRRRRAARVDHTRSDGSPPVNSPRARPAIDRRGVNLVRTSVRCLRVHAGTSPLRTSRSTHRTRAAPSTPDGGSSRKLLAIQRSRRFGPGLRAVRRRFRIGDVE